MSQAQAARAYSTEITANAAASASSVTSIARLPKRTGTYGERCATLSVGRPDGARGRIQVANHSSSWGGSAIRDDAGLHHLFYARFEAACGLFSWVNNSVCVHSVSSDALGPFVDRDVAVGTWCHGPKITRAADGTVDVLAILEGAFAISRGAGKKLLQQNAVSVNGTKLGADEAMMSADRAVQGRWLLVRKGGRDIALAELS